MTRGSSIVEFRGGESRAEQPRFADEAPAHQEWREDEGDHVRPSRIAPWAAVALTASLVWIAAMSLWTLSSPGSFGPLAFAQFIAALLVVPTFIGVVWLLIMRTSAAEARGFGDVAQRMRAEAAGLERKIAALSISIEANRERLADQVASLIEIGDAAAGHLAAIGREFDSEVASADGHARMLAEAVSVAQNKLSVLLSSLPHAHAQTVDAAALMERTGLSAGEHAAALDAQLVALADRGREADVVAGGAAQRLATHITRMEAVSESAGVRLEAVTGEMSTAVDALLDRTAQAVDEARKGITAQGDAMLAMVGANQASLDSAARESAEALAGRIAVIEQVIDRVAGRLQAQRVQNDEIVTELDQGMARVETRLDALHGQGFERTQQLAASISALSGSAEAMTEALRNGDTVATQAIGTAESLLVALDAAAREIDETLPGALARLDARIVASKGVVSSAKPELLALVAAAESTHDAIEAIAGVIADQRRTLDTLSGTLLDTLATGRSRADGLGTSVEETIERANRFSDEAAPRLVEALLRVRDTASAAADRARKTIAAVIPEAAKALEAAGAEAMRRAAGDAVDQQIKTIADAADAAFEAATRAADRLSVQVQAIVDQTEIVETRFEADRVERENAERDSFARRSSLLIESLNSAAIDVTKSFSIEVSDSAWAAYLKGDRGVFTRRAVRLLDENNAREIARLYDEDAGFRDAANRYIHDFEAMLRQVLAQRDGNTMGVTLLSSDMGKLYVALAQAIERLP